MRYLLPFLLVFSFLPAAQKEPVPGIDEAGYQLLARDLIRITVFGEELTVERRIDGNGSVSLPLADAVSIQGLTVAQAEEKIRQMYIDKEIFVRPQVAIAIVEYFRREVSVIGQVKNPGKIQFPIEANSLEIVEVISKAGGLTRIARAESVRVTRKAADGSPARTFEVNVERMFNGRGGAHPFFVLPGDLVFVPERVF